MRRAMSLWVMLAALACGSEPETSPPAQAPPTAPAAPSPAAAPPPPSFPAADQFRLGETVTLRGGGGAECQKLYLRDTLVAVVETWIHTGRGAVAHRCIGSSWAAESAPTAAELASVGTTLDGRLAADFDGLSVGADGTLTFQPLGMSDRVSELSVAGRFAAYATAANPRESAGGQEVDVVGVVFDLPARFPLQQYLLGSCRVRGSETLSLATPTWSSDARAVVFHGVADRCSFADVETHPE